MKKVTLSGFTFIKNGEKLGYPYLEAILSILPICDEVIVVVGKSEDDTKAHILNLKNPKIKIIDTVWDENLRKNGEILAQQTNIGLEKITSDWAIYIQGDEVLHEKDYETILFEINKNHDNSKVEALLFNYKHFYGSYQWLGNSLRWYRKEIRVVRNKINIKSYKDAQGFRRNNQKLCVKPINAEIFHYGWCRNPQKQKAKQIDFNKLYHDDNWMNQHPEIANDFDYHSFDSLIPFTETHPKVMEKIIHESNFIFQFDPQKIKIPLKERFKIWFEKWTGYRLWEYKNYKII